MRRKSSTSRRLVEPRSSTLSSCCSRESAQREKGRDQSSCCSTDNTRAASERESERASEREKERETDISRERGGGRAILPASRPLERLTRKRRRVEPCEGCSATLGTQFHVGWDTSRVGWATVPCRTGHRPSYTLTGSAEASSDHASRCGAATSMLAPGRGWVS